MAKKIARALLTALLSAFVLCGCNSGGEIEPEAIGYKLYYLLNNSTTLTTENYEAQTEDTDFLVLDLFNRMREPKEFGNISVIPKTLTLEGYSLSEAGALTLTFSENYSDMDTVSEILFRQAVVKTLVQIKEVETVTFYVGDTTLRSTSGVAYGPMNASTFVNDVEDAMENLAWINLTLYYADESGTSLVGETTRLAYSQNISIGQVIIEKLIEGPSTDLCHRSVPEDVDVISVTTRDGVCYVNLDSDFLNSVADCTAQVTLYSIVNSLCELNKIQSVQFQINGSSDYNFRETYALGSTYKRDLNLVIDSTVVEVESESETQTQ